MRYVLGSNARVAKLAARILVASKEHDDLCAEAAEVKMLSTLLDHAGSYSADATDESVLHVFVNVDFTDSTAGR